MGLFNFGKKKEADEASATTVAPADAAEMKKCAMCGEEKLVSEGNMMLEGTAFRCKDCADKPAEDEHGEVCEFC